MGWVADSGGLATKPTETDIVLQHPIEADSDRQRLRTATRSGLRRSGSLNGVRPRDLHRVNCVPDFLLTRIAEGDTTAVKACVDRYTPLVWTLARKFSSNDADAEDGVQEIFIDLWAHAGRFDASIASESTFVTMVARRRLIDRLRKKNRRISPRSAETDVVDQHPGADYSLETREEADKIKQAMTKLKPEEREVLELAVISGESQTAIADKLSMPVGTVKTHARRGMIRLRELVGTGRKEDA